MRSRFLFVALVLAMTGLVHPGSTLGVGEILDAHEGLKDVDNRTGTVAPTAAQRDQVQALGATARFNEFGTVQSLIKYGGFLATGLSSDPVAAARTFIDQNKVLFRLTSAGVSNLELHSDGALAGDAGHAITFRQTFGGVPALIDGLITVGIVDGKVSYASSRAAGDGNVPASASLSPEQAWVAAANDAGAAVSLAQIVNSRKEGDWTVLEVAGFGDLQRVRFGAVPTPQAGVLPAYEALVLPGGRGKNAVSIPGAYRSFVDARDGSVVARQNIEDHVAQAQTFTFSGAVPTNMGDGACDMDKGPFTAPPNTISIDVVATADNPVNDMVLHLLDSGHNTIASQDTGTSPEAIHYEPTGGVAPGDYFVRVCDFNSSTDDLTWLPPNTYTGSITFNDVAGTSPAPYPPRWKVFPAYPEVGLSAFPWNYPSTDIRQVWCWETVVTGNPVPGCDRELKNLAGRVPWDFDPKANQVTFTTRGNAAVTNEDWTDHQFPGPFFFAPVDGQREYVFPWNNTWFTEKCAPTSFQWPAEPDLSAAVTSLFVGHNRMHDWQYFLGFTEEHWNGQLSNFGSPTLENDPLVGMVQAGAVTGLGRDNAFMRTLPDGVSSESAMFLWQPIAGAFYAPCVDGDFDMGVIGHEFGHMTENRMIGKGANRSGHYAGAMGEAFGDLNGVEYLRELNFMPVSGEDPFSLGAYVTANKDVGIRNFNMSWPSAGAAPEPAAVPKINPLNLSDMGYDLTGLQVHADGEIWSATNFDIRQALIAKYNAQFPASDAALQRECAEGSLATAPQQCPGNRRWIQIVFDAMLLMPTAPTMLDARDAYLAADMQRFGGANEAELWAVFAKRGMGEFATAVNNTTTETANDPKPSFESPVHNSEATVQFSAVTSTAVPIDKARFFVGWYEARVTPIADTDSTNEPTPGGDTNLDNVAKFMPGTYEFVVQAPGFGHVRFRRTFSAGQNASVAITMPTNFASSTNGATASGDGANHAALIDDTEGTNWTSLDSAPVQGKQVIVDLAGSSPVSVGRVQVSALVLANAQRFQALRQFAIAVCNAATAVGGCGSPPLNYATVLTSAPDAFPSVNPRPASPQLILRSFSFSPVPATHVRMVVLNTQCTGAPDYQGDQDDDIFVTDCDQGSASGNDVRAAELEVFGPPAPVTPTADLAVTKDDSKDPARRGQNLDYIIKVTNNGPSTANGVTLTDNLPKNAGFGSATSTQGSCDVKPAKRIVTCNIGTMTSGQIVTVTITVKPTDQGTITNTVSVGATSPTDPNQSNNSDSETTVVVS